MEEVPDIIPAPVSVPSTGREPRDYFQWLIGAVVFVLFVGFAAVFIAATAMLIESYKFKGSAYEDLKDKVIEQSAKIDTLTNEINRQKLIPR